MKIYLIIREKIITRTLVEFLTSLGYQVITLSSMDKLLEIFNNDANATGLVISEQSSFRRPDRSIIKKIHKLYPSLLFVVIIDNWPIFSIKEAISLGIYGYLHKPISLVELELLLVRLKERRRV